MNNYSQFLYDISQFFKVNNNIFTNLTIEKINEVLLFTQTDKFNIFYNIYNNIINNNIILKTFDIFNNYINLNKSWTIVNTNIKKIAKISNLKKNKIISYTKINDLYNKYKNDKSSK